MWFKASASFNIIDAIMIPVVVLIPYIVGISLLFQIGRLEKKGQINSSAVTMLRFSISLQIILFYLVIRLLTSEITRVACR